MKIVKPRQQSSFFESFSDLIFATMAIFVMLLIIFISQVGSDEKRTQYTGSSAPTYSLIAHINIENVPSVLFFPISVADRFNLARSPDLNDPLLAMSEWAVSEDSMVSLPMADYVAMASGFSQKFADGIRSQGEGTIEASLLVQALGEENPPNGITAQTLKKQVFGQNTLKVLSKDSGEGKIQLSEPWRSQYQSARKWLESKEKNNFHSWISESRTPVRQNASQKMGDDAIVAYEILDQQRFRVGGTVLSPQQMRAFLRSIAPGRDFALVNVDGQGQALVPPNWVYDQVLQPTGFVASK